MLQCATTTYSIIIAYRLHFGNSKHYSFHHSLFVWPSSDVCSSRRPILEL